MSNVILSDVAGVGCVRGGVGMGWGPKQFLNPRPFEVILQIKPLFYSRNKEKETMLVKCIASKSTFLKACLQ